MIVLQCAVGGYDNNFSYLIYDTASKQAAVVDPAGKIELITDVIEKNHLKLLYIINTHYHFDHVEKNEVLQKKYKALVALHELENFPKDIALKHNQELKLGKESIMIYHTPGHTPGAICILAGGKLMTGDTLFIGTIGRTDFSDGSPKLMKKTLQFLASLPGELEILPGHDYGPSPTDTLKNQKKTNYFLQKITTSKK